MLPKEVLEKAAAEMTNVNGCGQSAMEVSHRSADFKPIIEKCEALFRSLLNINNDYEVLFLQGGASLQFAMVPLNLGARPVSAEAVAAANGESAAADYIDTGIWAAKAAQEAQKYINVNIAASSKDKNYTYIPDASSIKTNKSAAYLHLCLNNTIVGTAWHKLPDTGSVPLIADASSCLLSAPLDIHKFSLIYAGAQKNIGPAGCAVVIIKKELCEGKVFEKTPVMLRYDTHIKEHSLFNTPPCWCIYIISLVLENLAKSGGLKAMEKINIKKADMLYSAIDASKIFYSPVEIQSRSIMNIPFLVRDEAAKGENEKKRIEEKFLHLAKEDGLVNLAGHRLVGGLRASIYNAMPVEGVEKLCAFIKNFENKV